MRNDASTLSRVSLGRPWNRSKDTLSRAGQFFQTVTGLLDHIVTEEGAAIKRVAGWQQYSQSSTRVCPSPSARVAPVPSSAPPATRRQCREPIPSRPTIPPGIQTLVGETVQALLDLGQTPPARASGNIPGGDDANRAHRALQPEHQVAVTCARLRRTTSWDA